MKVLEGFRKFGTYLFDLLVITILLTLSLVLLFPFPFILTGVNNYFLYRIEDRRLANIFNILKPNFKILLKFSVIIIQNLQRLNQMHCRHFGHMVFAKLQRTNKIMAPRLHPKVMTAVIFFIKFERRKNYRIVEVVVIKAIYDIIN